MVKPILPITHTVADDEPCYWLTEQHLQSPGSRGFRRYQIVWVVRQDRLHQYVTDLGPASTFKEVEQFHVQGGGTDPDTGRIWIEHTVAELREIADMHRNGMLHRPEPQPLLDFKGALLDQLDQQRRSLRHQSVFGPYSRVERN